MRNRLLTLFLLAAALLGTTAVTPALAVGVPDTLRGEAALGSLAGADSRVVAPPFPVGYLGVSWVEAGGLSVRFATRGTWTAWQEVEDDGHPARGRTFSELMPASGADAYQLRGRAADVRAVAINTTDGPRAIEVRTSSAEATLTQPGVITRADWGADESLRFDSEGKEVWPAAFYPTKKLIVHHTATKHDDPDPAATVRAIYQYHAVDKGWGDIGYNFIVDAQGRIYKGRWSGPRDSLTGDTVTGENADGHGVTGAHVGGYNSGTMGIAVLGNYDRAVSPSTASVKAVTDHLAWEAQRHEIDPEGTSDYTNPVNGSVKEQMPNISAHRDWASTACPGKNLYAELPHIRTGAATVIAADTDDVTPPAAPTGLAATAGDTTVASDWADSPEADIAYYTVQRSTDGEVTWSDVSSTTTSRYDDTAVVNGSTYHYRGTATDGSGNPSEPSVVVTATPMAATTTTERTPVSAVTVDKGSTSETATADLDHDDGGTYDVSTVRQGRSHLTQWTARLELADPSKVTALTVRLDGSGPAGTTRVLSVLDSRTDTWTDVGTVLLEGSEVLTEWTASDLGVVSSAGALQLRVRTSGSSSGVSSTDVLHAVVTRTG